MNFLHRTVYAKAFTLVELVVIISVIGILATIGVVSYNGYQSRARTAAAIDGANQAADLLEAYQLKNGGNYPAALTDAGITNGSVTYDYTVAADGKNYCVTSTSKNISYKMSQDAKPTAGGCPGHSANGVAAVTNLSTNPRATAAGIGWLSNNNAVWTVTRGVAISGHPAGITTAARSQIVSGQTNATLMSLYNADTLGNSATSRSLGVWVYANTPANACVGAGSCSNYTIVNANTWTYIRSAAPGTGWGALYFNKASGVVLTTDYAYATGMIAVTDSTAPAYADGGSTADWVWTNPASAPNSTSKGPRK